MTNPNPLRPSGEVDQLTFLAGLLYHAYLVDPHDGHPIEDKWEKCLDQAEEMLSEKKLWLQDEDNSE